jgi:PAS domain S-box-containing protein
MLESLPAHGNGIVEPLWCSQGCINGPGIGIDSNLFNRRKEVLEYDRDANDSGFTPAVEEDVFLGCSFKEEPGVVRQVSEDEIQRVFERTGKTDPQQQLNCGACGYESCREKAKAVVLGMAEEEMCIPNMRRLAERRTDRIIDTSPNGIIIVDEELNIISMNPTFRKFFSCSNAVLGRHVSYLMDPAPFEKLIAGMADSLDIIVHHRSYNLLTRQMMYIMKEERQIVAIFHNITSQQEHEKKLNEIRAQTIEQANDLLEHQLRMAQQMAQFLGENTARGEALVRKLMSLSEADEKEPD